MTISDRIFEKLAKTGMTQKKFSEETGIQQSTIIPMNVATSGVLAFTAIAQVS